MGGCQYKSSVFGTRAVPSGITHHVAVRQALDITRVAGVDAGNVGRLGGVDGDGGGSRGQGGEAGDNSDGEAHFDG